MGYADSEKARYLNVNASFDMENTSCLATILNIMPVDQFDSYPETPEESVVFAQTGSNGFHYVLVDNEYEKGIYLIIPNGHPSRFKVAQTMDEFLSYAISIYGLFEVALTCDEITFLEVLGDCEADKMVLLGSKRCFEDMMEWQKSYQIRCMEPHLVYQRLQSLKIYEKTSC